VGLLLLSAAYLKGPPATQWSSRCPRAAREGDAAFRALYGLRPLGNPTSNSSARTRCPQRGPGLAAERGRRAHGRHPSPSAPKCIPSTRVPHYLPRSPSPSAQRGLSADAARWALMRPGTPDNPSELGEALGHLLHLRGGERQRGTEKRAVGLLLFLLLLHPDRLNPPAAPALP